MNHTAKRWLTSFHMPEPIFLDDRYNHWAKRLGATSRKGSYPHPDAARRIEGSAIFDEVHPHTKL